jgi:hypothetical protein
MATADEYATWIVKNADKKGTSEFDTVAAAYKDARQSASGGVPIGRTASTQEGTMGAYTPRREVPKPGMFDFLSAPFEMGQALAAKPRAEQAAFIAPTVEALGAAGGGLMGAPLGPVGAIGGAGAGYAGAKGLMRLIGGTNVAEPVSKTAQRVASDVAEGATMEVGGQLAGKALGYAAGKVSDLRQLPDQKAAVLAQKALGNDLPQVLNILRNAPVNASVADLTAKIENPLWQAFLKNGLEKDPQFVRKMQLMSERESRNELAKLVGGATATDIRATGEAAKQNLNALTTPMRETALSRANLGKAVAGYETEAQQLAAQAAGKVQDVRRLTQLGAQAETASATVPLRSSSGERIGMPLLPGRYTYPGDLAKKADEWATGAANASLDLGQGSRFAQSAADTLRSAGIKPLESEPLVQSIQAVTRNNEFAGNDVMSASVSNLARDISQWTGSGGVIDAKALDAIRKNSVNAAVRDLLKGQSPDIQRQAAAGAMSRLKPLIDDAIESAGGVGYKQYLADYSKGMQRISEQKLTGEAARLWKTDKDAFVRLVQNESPDVVEKFLGRGNYNIASELTDSTMSVLQKQAEKRLTELSVKEQVSQGGAALTDLLKQETSRFRFPSLLNFWAIAGNKTLAELEEKIGVKTMKIITEASKTPSGTIKLLETLPANERNRVIQLISNPQQWKPGAAAAAGIAATNALAPQQQNQNALIGQ